VLLDGKALSTTNWTNSEVVAQLPKDLSRQQLEDLGWRDRKDSELADLIVRDDVGNSSPAVQMEIALPPPQGPAEVS
jgi:hypothetical protein